MKILANPVIPPPIISEVYLNGNIIQIEFFFQSGWEFENFDEFYLVSSIDTIAFIDGIEIIPNEIMVLDQNDFVGSFEYIPEGDQIYIIDNGYYEFRKIRFGNYPGAFVPAPNENQSIAFHDFYYPAPPVIHDYWLCLEQPPSIGAEPFNVNARGIIEGHVFDLNNNPISGVSFSYPYYDIYVMWDVVTDSTGFFWMPQLICKNYNGIQYSYGNLSGSLSASVLPNETTNVEIQLDTLISGIPEYHNYPNPFSGSTSFIIQIPDNLNYNSAYVCIYNLSGKLVDRIDFSENQNSVNWQNTKNEPGVYLYNLVLDNKKYATQKMIIL